MAYPSQTSVTTKTGVATKIAIAVLVIAGLGLLASAAGLLPGQQSQDTTVQECKTTCLKRFDYCTKQAGTDMALQAECVKKRDLCLKACDSQTGTTTTTQAVPPAIMIVSPIADAKVSVGSQVKIEVQAKSSISTASIAKVDVSINGQVVTTLTAPSITGSYTYTWTTFKEGTNMIAIKATDTTGLFSTATISVSVVPNQSSYISSVKLTAPISGATYTAPANVSMLSDISTITGVTGSIAKVEYYAKSGSVGAISSLIGTVTTQPYSFTWTGVSSGTYTVTAKAYDNLGMFRISPEATITVNESGSTQTNKAPLISLVSPITGTLTGPATISMKADAKDEDGTIAKVDFYAGSNLINSDSVAPYGYEWTNVPAGTYVISAVATDNKGSVAKSTEAKMTVTSSDQVANKPPTVSITMPVTGTTLTMPEKVVINANATDSDGTVTKVEFYLDGNFLGADLTAPYSIDWLKPPAKTYNLTAKALDNGGLSTISGVVVVTITGSTP